jgi:hypothetical protein
LGPKVIWRATAYVLTVPVKFVSTMAIRPPLKRRLTLFSARLSTAWMPKFRPLAMSCVSPWVLTRRMAGGVISRWMPPGLRVVSHDQTASASAPIPVQFRV